LPTDEAARLEDERAVEVAGRALDHGGIGLRARRRLVVLTMGMPIPPPRSIAIPSGRFTDRSRRGERRRSRPRLRGKARAPARKPGGARRVKPVAGKTRAARKGAAVTHKPRWHALERRPARVLASNNEAASPLRMRST
jgi:hypothetical protein